MAHAVTRALLADNAPAMVGRVDADGVLVDADGALLDRLGYPAEQLVGLSLRPLVDHPEFSALLDRGLAGRRGETVIRLATRTWRIAIAPIDSSGEVICVFTLEDDVLVHSELSERERQLQMLAALVDRSADFIAMADLDGVVTYVNTAGRALVGVEEDQALGRPTRDYFTERGLERSMEIEEAVRTAGFWEGESELRDFRTGDGIPVSVNSFLVRAADSDEPLALATVQRDIRGRIDHETRLAEGLLEQQSIAALGVQALTLPMPELLRAAVDTISARSPELVIAIFHPIAGGARLSSITSSADGHQAFVQPVSKRSPAGLSLLEDRLVTSDDIQTDERFDVTAMTRHVAGVLACPVPGASGPWGVIGVGDPDRRSWTENDVTFVTGVAATVGAAVQRYALEAELQHRALHDPLTGLPNRALTLDRIDQALARTRRSGGLVVVLLGDVDDFGSINDSLGQEAGDELLGLLAERLSAWVPVGETVARTGGDEFAIVCEGLGADDVGLFAEGLLAATSTRPGLGRHGLRPTLSLGVALASPSSSAAADLLTEADIALARARRDRPGGYRIFDEGMRGEVLGRFNLAGELRASLQDDTLDVVYQPIVSLRSGEVIGLEALARWTTSAGEVVPPDVFVSLAEDTGLIGDLGLSVLRKATRAAVDWQETRPVSLRVNVSAHELQSPAYADQVAAVLRESGLPPALLGLEITESVLVDEATTTQETLARLHQSGVGLLIDDFGTGFSSLSYLQRFPHADVLKIDKSFVIPDPGGEAVVRAVVGLGRAFGLAVCAEGVGDAEQLVRMRELGCDYAQGFHLSRPVPGNRVVALLRDWRPADVR